MLQKFKIVCLIILCIYSQGIAQNKRNPVLDKEISLKANEQTLKEVLDKIFSKTGLSFSYDPTVFNDQKVVSFEFNNRKTEEILNEIFLNEYDFKVLQNQVIITKPIARINGKRSNSVLHGYIKMSGRIENRFNKKPIPYASISILGKPIGTITNVDGDFDLKIKSEHKMDTLVISCLGYNQLFIELDTLNTSKLSIALRPIDIRLQEIKVTAVDPLIVIDQMLENIRLNYPFESFLMTGFYREVLLQDEKYINVSEAVLNILKTSYESVLREDRIRYLKGRKSHEVSPFKWVDFKMQGGPYYITKLDVIKTMDTFLDPEYRNLYEYQTERLIKYLGRPAYIISFRPVGKMNFLSYEGKLIIDKKTYALLHAEFELGRDGKKVARRSLIRKKPKTINVRPLDLKYEVSYKETNGKWHLSTAKTSVKFKVKSKRDKINSVFHSLSDLLITNHERTKLKRFEREERFSSDDIFTEIIEDYDSEFWGQFNIIKPSEDLRKAIDGIQLKDETKFNKIIKPSKYITKKSPVK